MAEKRPGARLHPRVRLHPRARLRPRARLLPVQWAALIGSAVILAWSIPGLIVNPDFGVGDSASAVTVLGSDMNGWHAVSGFVVVAPALVLLRRPDLLAVYLLLAAGSLIATGVWALFDTQPAAGLFSFPNNENDALLHFATSTIYLAGALHQLAGRGAAVAR
jgi:hypothetical protein